MVQYASPPSQFSRALTLTHTCPLCSCRRIAIKCSMILFVYCLSVWKCNGVCVCFFLGEEQILNNFFYRKSDGKIVAISADGFEQLKQSENIGKWVAFVQMWMVCVCTCFVRTRMDLNKRGGNGCCWATMHSIAHMPTMRIIDLFSLCIWSATVASPRIAHSNLCSTQSATQCTRRTSNVRLKLFVATRPYILFFHSRHLFWIHSFGDLVFDCHFRFGGCHH